MNIQEEQEYYKQFDTTKGAYYIQHERVDDLNSRLRGRQFPDTALEPNYDPRPIPTKYSLFPILDRRTPVKVPKMEYDTYDTEKTFAPISGTAHFSGYSANVDTEIDLRNQRFALQRDCILNSYIPSSDSDLYKVTIVSKPSEQPFKDLFRPNEFDKSTHPNLANATSIGNDKFFNHTRTQLRNTVN